MLYELVLGNDPRSAKLISNGLLGDIVLSQWAADDVVAAMDTLLTRQIAVDELYRNKTRVEQPRLTPLELARIHAPLTPKLATLRAAIYATEDDEAQAAITLDSAISSILAMAALYELQVGEAGAQVIDMHLQVAWVAVWLGNDSEITQNAIQHVESLATISPTEKQRLDGWVALRNNQLAEAKKLLGGLPADDAAHAGLGLVFLAEGNKQAAANEFLAVARNQGGTLLGVWSKQQLQRIVGRSFDIRPEVKELRALLSGLLQTLRSFHLDPRPTVSLRVNPTQLTFESYEPILVNIELTNNTSIPLTIAKNGPIQPLLLIESFLQISGVNMQSVPPIIIPIDRQLAINSRETIVIQANLREQWIGGVLNSYPLQGANIELRSTLNFTARESKDRIGNSVLVYEVGKLGAKRNTDLFRVDGVRLTDTWLKLAIEKAASAKSVQDITNFILLTYVVGDSVSIKVDDPLIPPPEGEEPEPVLEGERLGLQDDAITTILSTFPSLGKYTQAWIVSTMSDDPAIEAVVGMMKDSDQTVAQLAWILRFASGEVPDEALDDPRLLSALESENEEVKTVATWMYERITTIVRNRADQIIGSPEQGIQ